MSLKVHSLIYNDFDIIEYTMTCSYNLTIEPFYQYYPSHDAINMNFRYKNDNTKTINCFTQI